MYGHAQSKTSACWVIYCDATTQDCNQVETGFSTGFLDVFSPFSIKPACLGKRKQWIVQVANRGTFWLVESTDL